MTPIEDQRADVAEKHSFDELAKGLADGTISRRRALKLVGSAILGAGLLGSFTGTAGALSPKCSNGVGCSIQCTHTGGRDCRCVRIAELTSTGTHKKRCVRPCCSNRGCNASSDCRSTEVCMYSTCCNDVKGVCVTLCTEPKPNYCSNTMTASGTTTQPASGQQVWDNSAAA